MLQRGTIGSKNLNSLWATQECPTTNRQSEKAIVRKQVPLRPFRPGSTSQTAWHKVRICPRSTVGSPWVAYQCRACVPNAALCPSRTLKRKKFHMQSVQVPYMYESSSTLAANVPLPIAIQPSMHSSLVLRFVQDWRWRTAIDNQMRPAVGRTQHAQLATATARCSRSLLCERGVPWLRAEAGSHSQMPSMTKHASRPLLRHLGPQ
eukprot:scaffold1954_cov268-Pinguiococcus_pyrenoidosus.AAC.220